MKWYQNAKMAVKIILPVTIVLTCMLLLLAFIIQKKNTDVMRAMVERELAATAGKYGNEIKVIFEEALDKTQAVAESLSSIQAAKHALSREGHLALLRGLLSNNKNFVGIGIAYEPNGLDGQDEHYKGMGLPENDATGRFVPYLAGGALEPLLDLDNNTYYQTPKKDKKPHLSNPYPYIFNGKEHLITTACAPIIVQHTFTGVVVADILLDQIASLVNAIKLYDSGFGTILAPGGVIISTPDSSLLNKNIFDLDLIHNPSALRKAMQDGKAYSETFPDGDKTTLSYYYPIHFSSTGQTWYFAVTAPMKIIMAEVADMRIMTVGISLTALVLVLLVIFFTVRTNVKPLASLSEFAEKIAGGKLDTPIDDSRFGGEMLTLSSSLKEMLSSLLASLAQADAMSQNAQNQAAKAEQAVLEAELAKQEAEKAKREGMHSAVEQLEDVVGIISKTSAILSADLSHCEKGATDQAGKIGETAAAMEEMNCTVLEVARNASDAAEVSHHTRGKAEDGARIVSETIERIQGVQEISLALKESMNTLDSQADGINTIMGVISDIADQTNLLALNAAIEAARAGEAGRGFAVVADEVRKLAEKTMASTTDVGNSIKSIQESVKTSIAQTDHAAELIAMATDQATKSGDALKEIVNMVDLASDKVRGIATASEEQSATSEEINKAVSSINTVALSTMKAMQGAANDVDALAEQAKTLEQLIAEMEKI